MLEFPEPSGGEADLSRMRSLNKFDRIAEGERLLAFGRKFHSMYDDVLQETLPPSLAALLYLLEKTGAGAVATDNRCDDR